MWELLPQREQVDKHQWLHVGDNEHSDIQRPLDQGFSAPGPCHAGSRSVHDFQ